MEQAENLMWMKRRQMMSTGDDHASSWEEKAFAEDHAAARGGGPLGFGGCVWPPRCYSCSFCKRQFRSAQALGGHMNVHRRDRARLKQNALTLQQNLHSLSSSRVSAQESPSKHRIIMSPHKSKREEYSATCPQISSHEEDFVETDLCVGFHSNRTNNGACKRHHGSSGSSRNSSISGFSFFMIKPYCSYDHHIQYSEVMPATDDGAIADIDLELRL